MKGWEDFKNGQIDQALPYQKTRIRQKNGLVLRRKNLYLIYSNHAKTYSPRVKFNVSDETSTSFNCVLDYLKR